jgi:hypothetical protein
MTRDDIQALRTPLMVLGGVLIAAALLVYFSASMLESSRQQLSQREGQLREARLRIQNAGEEKEMIGQYLAGYQQLARAGFVGEEQRINWLDSLRTANQETNIFGVEYEISAQHAYPHAAEFNPGQLELQESVMRLRLQLLHEGDLPRFFQALARQGGGFFTIDQCVMRRTKAGEVERSMTFQPNLAAECELSWLTAKPASAAGKKG